MSSLSQFDKEGVDQFRFNIQQLREAYKLLRL